MFSIEYLQLDRQLNQLDAVLTVLEEKNDKLHEEAIQFLLEARKMREEQEKERQTVETNKEEPAETNSEEQKEETK